MTNPPLSPLNQQWILEQLLELVSMLIILLKEFKWMKLNMKIVSYLTVHVYFIRRSSWAINYVFVISIP